VNTPAGSWNCWRYTRTEVREGLTRVTTAFFAKSLPGPPVKMIVAQNGETLYEVTLLETGGYE
jgi:hypothetical protein